MHFPSFFPSLRSFRRVRPIDEEITIPATLPLSSPVSTHVFEDLPLFPFPSELLLVDKEFDAANFFPPLFFLSPLALWICLKSVEEEKAYQRFFLPLRRDAKTFS